MMAKGRLVIKKKGGAGVAAGAVLMLFPFVLALSGPIGPLPLPMRDYLPRLVWMALFLTGLRTFAKGMRKRRLTQKLLRLQGLFDHGRRVPLQAITKQLGCSLTALVGDVRSMQRYKLVQGLYADLYRKDLVYAGDEMLLETAPPAEDNGFTLREEHKKSVLPIYVFGVVWASYALFFPLYRTIDLVLALFVALIISFRTAWNAPSRAVILEVPPQALEPVQTGDQELDELLRGVQTQMDNLRKLDKAIDGKLEGPVAEILRTTELIVGQVKKAPGKSKQMRQFFNYTLPTTIRLLQNYHELRSQPVQGGNIAAALEKIEGMMCTIVDAFHRQLDALFADKALDIDVELQVMGQMLSGAGDFEK